MILRSDNIHIVECSLDKIDLLPTLLQGKFDSFYHLGWTNTDKDGRNDSVKQGLNIDYTLKALKAAKKTGCKLFVGAGSQAEYGRYDIPISEDFEPRPETQYGKAKLEAGKVSAQESSILGIKHVWTRIFSAYGPHDQTHTMIMYCIGKFLKKEKASFTACTQIWDYIYSTDAAKAIISAGQNGRHKEVYNIGSGTGRELKEYVNIIADLTGGVSKIGFGDIKTPDKGLMNLTANISKISGETGFCPSVNFEDGIKETIKWYKENYL
jgi:nucleoside-diphosphate-sugar epimerase